MRSVTPYFFKRGLGAGLGVAVGDPSQNKKRSPLNFLFRFWCFWGMEKHQKQEMQPPIFLILGFLGRGKPAKLEMEPSTFLIFGVLGVGLRVGGSGR